MKRKDTRYSPCTLDLSEAVRIISDNGLPLLTKKNFQTPPFPFYLDPPPLAPRPPVYWCLDYLLDPSPCISRFIRTPLPYYLKLESRLRKEISRSLIKRMSNIYSKVTVKETDTLFDLLKDWLYRELRPGWNLILPYQDEILSPLKGNFQLF